MLPLEIFFDKKFLIEYQSSNGTKYLNEFKEFFEKLDIFNIYIFNCTNDEEWEKLIKESVLLRLIKKPFYPKFLNITDLDKSDFFSSSDFSPFRIFFIEKSNIDLLRNSYGFEFISSKMFDDVWEKYSIRRSDRHNELPITDRIDIDPKFDNLTVFKNFNHPFNSMIVCDRYVFKSKKSFEENLLVIIANLIEITKSVHSVELTLVSEKFFDDDLPEAKQFISESLQKELQRRSISLNFRICLIKTEKNNNNYTPVHSRAIFTNYWMINPDHSFEFFRNGKLEKHGNIYFHCILYGNYRNLACAGLAEVKTNIINTEEFPGHILNPTQHLCGKKPKENRLINNIQ